MNTIDSIIFDVDGTLWDSTEIVAAAWNEVIAQETDLSLHITSATLKSLFGQTLPDIAKCLFPDYSTARQVELIDLCCEREHEALSITLAPVYANVPETLAFLSSQVPLYLVSNCEAGYIEVFLESTKLAPYFCDHLCPGDTGNAKASNILEIMNRHHLSAPIYVGDTAGDYTAAKDAGIPFIFASYGFGQVDNPDAAILQFSDLPSLFKSFSIK